MSESNEPTERNRPEEPNEADTDRLEGSYTEVDGQAPHERTVAGAYTRTDGRADDDESIVGDYTSTEKHPDTHDASERRGKFIRTDEPKPHPGPHKV